MSKIRQDVPSINPLSPIQAEATGDAKPYVIFTQLKERGPHIYAGWLEATDDEMAMVLAKEHYGRDQECVGIWAIERTHLQSSDGLYSAEAARDRRYAMFSQKKPGDLFLEAGIVEADSPAAAIDTARRTQPQCAKAHCVWAAAHGEILATEPDELIWRTTDQTYRLARGYTRLVKEKWRQFRGEEALSEYEREDLKEEF